MAIRKRGAILVISLSIMLCLIAEGRTGEIITGSTVVVVKSASQICGGYSLSDKEWR